MAQAAQAQQQLDAGQLGEARAAIAEAINERDDIAELHLLKGRIELASNRFGPAYDAYASALALDAANLEALQGVAQLGLRTGHLRESEDAAERLLTLQPDQLDALSIKALIALVRGRPKETISDADRILATDPDNEAAIILKSRALYLLGQPQQALAALGEAAPNAANSQGFARTRLELLREGGDAAGMLEVFGALRKLSPKDVDLRLDEANLRYKTGDAAGARRVLQDAIFVLNPDASQVAQITSLWREYDREPISSDALGRLASGTNVAAKLGVARYLLETGRADRVAKLLSGVASLDARALEARAAIALGKTAAGALAATRVLADDATQCDALIAKSEADLRAGRAPPAIVAAQTAAAECPRNSQTHHMLARAYGAKRDDSGVRRAFTQGIAANPQDSVLSKAFSEWLGTRGDRRQAIAEARRLTRKAPALVSGWQQYGAICARWTDPCTASAASGLARARQMLGVDLAPGTLPTRGLFGRLPAR